MQGSQGYSLVELLVGLSVLAAATLLVTPAFKSATGNAQIRTIAESIRNGLQQARVEAIKRNTKIRFALSTDSRWQFGCVTTTTTCPAVIVSKSAAEGAGAGLSIQADAYSVTFSSFGTRDPAASTALSEVVVSNSLISNNDLRALKVLLAAGGYSRVCDPVVTTAGDPRKC